MSWVLWVCVISMAGVCGVERSFLTKSQADCQALAKSARVEFAPTHPVSVQQATVVEINGRNSVIILCKPK